MKVLQLQQNSPEWEEYRLGKSGGSDAGKLYPYSKPSAPLTKAFLAKLDIPFGERESIESMLIKLNPEQLGELKAEQPKLDEFYRIVAERVARPITPNDYEDRLDGRPFSMMERGHILEPEALEMFEKVSGKKLDKGSVVWERSDNPLSYVSPDGGGTVKGKVTFAAEVKCPESHKMIRAWHENQYPQEYSKQIVKYFVVNDDLEVLYFVLYTDVIPALPILIFEVHRKDIKSEIEEYKSFEDAILKQVDELVGRLTF